MIGTSLLGPGAGGFGKQLPPDFRELFGADLRGPGIGGYGPDLFRQPSQAPGETFEPLVIPPGLVPSIRYSFAQRSGLVPALSYGLGEPLPVSPSFPFQDGEVLERQVGYPWNELKPAEQVRAETWQDTRPLERAPALPWANLKQFDAPVRVVHRDGDPLESVSTLGWGIGIPFEHLTRAPIGRFDVVDQVRAIPWPIPDLVHPDWHIPWGFGRHAPTITPHPDIDDPLPPDPGPPPIYIPPAGDNVGLDFKCPLHQGDGSNVDLPLRRFECIRSQYVIENTVTCTRVDTGESVQCLDLSISGDIESYTDAFNATLPHSAADFLVDGPIEVLFDVNGQQFLMLAERVRESGDFDRETGRSDTIRVSGRSVTSELDEPHSPPKSRFETEGRNALQLMNQELPIGSDWTISAHPAWGDWFIPGDTFSYQGLSPIRAIARIAEATGAVVQQVPGVRELRIVPRYTVDPWKQAAAEADVEIDFGQVANYSKDFEPVALANGVYIAGENANGVLVKGTRTGTLGDPWLDIVVDALITDPQAGLQRARAELGATGKRDIYGLQIPLKLGPEDPGLVRPGQIVSVVESVAPGDFWQSQAISWNLNATWDDATGLTIWQNVGLERYRDE